MPKQKTNGSRWAQEFTARSGRSFRSESVSGWMKEKLHADPRGLTVTYYNGTKAPCPCVADGVMIATQASPGQGSLQISPEKAPDDLMAVMVIENRKTGEGLRYPNRTNGCPRYSPGSSPMRRRVMTPRWVPKGCFRLKTCSEGAFRTIPLGSV